MTYTNEQINEFRKQKLIEDQKQFSSNQFGYTTDKQLKISLAKAGRKRLEQLMTESN